MEIPDEKGGLRFEIKNSRPVELIDLTQALSAFGQAYEDFVASEGGIDGTSGNIKLYVREIRAGSIIADLASVAEQASFVLKYLDVLGAFVTHINDIARHFLDKPMAHPPTKKEAAQIISIMEPVAKDHQSNVNITINGPAHFSGCSFNSQQANAVQNGARRYIGPQIPVSEVRHDELMRLHQVRGDVTTSVGDRGIIEAVSSSPVKLAFSSEAAKRAILEASYLFDCVFVVDVEVKSSNGKVALYRVLSVKDVITPA